MAPSQLQIKTNALKRLLKEESLYQQEVTEQEKFVSQMQANNTDEYELKKQVQVLDESKRMVPEVSQKIKEHKELLKKYLDEYSGSEDLSESKQLVE